MRNAAWTSWLKWSVRRTATNEEEEFLMAIYGYVRDSSRKQEVLAQIHALKSLGCERIFRERRTSAVARKRPKLLALQKLLRCGDTFAVAAIDRAFRNTREALTFLDDVLKPIGARFLSIRDRVDTETPEGRRWYTIEAAEAEYERARISIRTREGMAALKRKGRKFGRPRKLTKRKIARAREEVKQRRGRSMERIAKRLRISRRSLYRALSSGA
jgi:DNA invertase Pin-like site-specific DNA recombinase